MKIILNLIFLACSFLGGIYFEQTVHAESFAKESTSKKEVKASVSDVVFNYIKNDLNEKIHAQKSGSPWLSVKQVSQTDHSELAKVFIGKKPMLSTLRNGKYRIEIDYLDIIDPEKSGIAVQLNLFDLKNNNKIEEYNKTYFFNEIPTAGSTVSALATSGEIIAEPVESTGSTGSTGLTSSTGVPAVPGTNDTPKATGEIIINKPTTTPAPASK